MFSVKWIIFFLLIWGRGAQPLWREWAVLHRSEREECLKGRDQEIVLFMSRRKKVWVSDRNRRHGKGFRDQTVRLIMMAIFTISHDLKKRVFLVLIFLSNLSSITNYYFFIAQYVVRKRPLELIAEVQKRWFLWDWELPYSLLTCVVILSWSYTFWQGGGGGLKER